jgi:superfamily II DNA helicase RecQ
VLFGETPMWTSCGACDVCAGQLAWLTAVPPAATRRKAPATKWVDTVEKIAEKRVVFEPPRPASIASVTDELREHLRQWRRTTSKELRVPAFIIMHDTTLDELCRVRPTTLLELRNVSGFGDRKVEMYGEQILAALKSFGPRTRGATP